MRIIENRAECLYDKQQHLTDNQEYLKEIKTIIDNRREDDTSPYLVYLFGEVSEQTVFSYHQKDNVIWAEYSGGSIVKGVLIGTMDEENKLHFSYQHINTDGEMRFGTCDSRPETVDGKLRFYESWKWTEGEEGTSVIEEI